MIPLEEAVGWLLKAGYSAIRYFPTERHPTWLQVMQADAIDPDKLVLMGSISVTDRKVPTRDVSLRTEPPPLAPAEILAMFAIVPA